MKGAFTVGTTPLPVAQLVGMVGPRSEISMNAPAGLVSGKAVIVVWDRSRTDNFRLVGPGVNRATGVAFRGIVKWTVTLKSGTYRFRSDRHPKLRGAFAVSSS